MSRGYSRGEVGEEILGVATTLDEGLQGSAETALEEGLTKLDRRLYPKTHRKLEGCLIAVDPQTGQVKAYAGGRDFSKSQFDHVLLAHRQPGSSFKPFVYAAALETAFTRPGAAITPATIISDEEW